MKEKFNKQDHQNFINYFKIKENPSEIELNFYKKTEKYIKYIKWIPGLKMIGIGNSIAMNCATKNSDIDLLIVTTNNSMWLNRILITLIFQILGVRKNPKNHAGRFCLSFFCTIDGLDFSSWKLENDIYLYYWILYFKPILNIDNTYELFIKKNNWADFSEYSDIIDENKKITSPQPSPYRRGSIKKILLKCFHIIPSPIRRGLGGGLNLILKKIFLPKTLKHYKHIGKPYGVIINNNLLKFHNGDIREKIKKDLV